MFVKRFIRKITDKRFDSAPNYAELGMTEYIEHSEEVIELSEERMIEIGGYFRDLIEEIENKLAYGEK